MLTRRNILVMGLAAAGAGAISPALANQKDWIEVIGMSATTGPADRDAARRRALADALLSAALAGGALVKGHSVMSNTRLTSDLLIVRPVGSVLAHQVISEDFDGHIWRITIRAKVGQPSAQACGDKRQMFVTMYPPQVRVSPSAPAWAAAMANDLGYRLAELAERDPSVAQLTRVDRLPKRDPAQDRSDYLALVSGSVRPEAGGHGLFTDIIVEPAGRELQMSLTLRLDGPAGERITKSHQATVKLPGVSALARLAVLAQPDRETLAYTFAKGARPALSALLHEAGCRPVLARLELSGGKLVVPVGRAHGVKRTSLAFTVDGDASTEMLEVVKLGDRRTTVAPLDPARDVASFAGRPVRFLDTVERLW